MSGYTLRPLLESSVSDIDRMDRDGHTPLFWAVYRGDMSSVEMLLTSGADVNADGSALVWSCSMKFSEPSCLRMLLEAGANPSLTDMDGFTALQACIINHRSMDFVDMLMDFRADLDQIYRGDDQSLEGMSAISLACLYGPGTTLVRQLLSYGADIDHVDFQGRSLLNLALARSPRKDRVKHNSNLVRVLLSSKINLDRMNASKYTATHDAMLFQDLESLDLLMDHGANIVWPTSRGPAANGYYQLAWVFETNNHVVLGHLLKGRTINLYDVCTATKRTVLHLLAMHASQRTAVVFEEWSSAVPLDPTKLDGFGKSPKFYLRGRPAQDANAVEEVLQRMASRQGRHITLGDQKEAADIFCHTPLCLPEHEIEVDPMIDGYTEKDDRWEDSTYGSDESREVSDDEDEGLGFERPSITRHTHLTFTDNRSDISLHLAGTTDDPFHGANEVLQATDNEPRGLKNITFHQPQDPSPPTIELCSYASNDLHRWRSRLCDLRDRVFVSLRLLASLPAVMKLLMGQLFAIMTRPRVPANSIRITWKCVSLLYLSDDAATQTLTMYSKRSTAELNCMPTTRTPTQRWWQDCLKSSTDRYLWLREGPATP